MFYIYYLVLFFGIGVLTTFLPVFFVQETILTSSQVTMMMSFMPIVSLISQNSFAYLSDKTKKYKAVLLGVMLATMIGAIMLLFGARSEQIIVVIGCYFLFAFFYPIPGMLTENFTLEYAKDRGIPYGRIRLFGSLGFAVAGQVAGMLTDNFGITIIFYVYVACILIPMLFVPKFPDIVETEEEAEIEKTESKQLYRQLFSNKNFVLIMLCSFFILGPIQVTGTFFGLYITEHAGLSLSILGTMTLLSAGTEIPMMFLSNKLIEKFGVYKILALGSSINAVRFLVYFLFPQSKFLILLVTATHGFGYGATFPAIMHIIGEEVPTNMRASAISLNTSLAIGFGHFLVSFIGSFLFNARSIYMVLAVIEACGLVLCVWLLRKNSNHLRQVNEKL